jgi:quercetin 2,3-dioxygenase
MRKVLGVYSAPRPHWVGDGFPVRTLFSHQSHGQHVSPFLLLDYAGPAHFEPTTHRRGVGEHPHRGFETVTIVYHGEVEHRDSTGAGGTIGPGDVQWMTAASGILHEEYHSPAFARRAAARDGAALGQPAGQGQDVEAGLPDNLDTDIPAVACPGRGAASASSQANHEGHKPAGPGPSRPSTSGTCG